ncbi:hypothetical protein [Acidiphilium iwatense]|uniref:Uncharacterized protein n=1 Tax=Acidiphilium iwatense TaxID=768198 RepID=A0ABS9E1P5_9PROT|nr:hypothetical protein [Acidiphilium iwatense]MCF3948922.1 hypothetical protein [Acidiphilium iwatense]
MRERQSRHFNNGMPCRFFTHHPRGNVRQRAIQLADRQKLFTLVPIPPRDRHRLATPRMKTIENPPFGVVIPGSISLLRRARERRIWRPDYA